MDKRYQVFVSSTFTDLKDERSKVIQTIMELDCIPAGMEIFPAIDEEQFNFIKRVIDDCDYYILIIGGRYGTVSEDGISYTEKEYEYAIGKGIKVLAFIHSEPEIIPFGKSEQDDELREKLKAFREKAATGRIVKFWKNADELPGLVALSLPKTIRTYPAVGWVRANASSSPELLQELNDVRRENEKLRSQIEVNKTPLGNALVENLAGLDDIIKINGVASRGYAEPISWEIKVTWKEIFFIISPYILETPYDSRIEEILSKALFYHSNSEHAKDSAFQSKIFKSDYQTIKIHFKALGLINLTLQERKILSWSLTEKGESLMLEIRSVKKELENSKSQEDE